MQFIPNGPDIPEALLEAHEDGRVVFFCGAGISYPAGLPGFGGLVDAVYGILGTTRDAIEQQAFDRGQYDATLDLLERRIPGQRIAVRNAIAQVLQPNLRRKDSKDTHVALLELGRSRGGALRLVTTNFDRVFETVAKKDARPCLAHVAPMLPIPKSSRWNGLVYLHGLLPLRSDDSALHRLVVSSGDFGLAYLTERWAARFVTELFRNYVVCFVGYSINDPVLRYMMDALAADRMLGEVTPQAYALGDFEPAHEKSKLIEWNAKGVTPILYEVPAGTHDHSALHKTLKVWAETYRDGVLGKERIVVQYAPARPSASTKQDDFVGRMLWALSHDSGLPAKRFAEVNPVPPIDWLSAFSDERFRHSDLSRFGVPPRPPPDSKLSFSLVRRPAPYTLASWMTLTRDRQGAVWDEVMFQVARWLMRHLNDPELIYWIVERGARLHHRLKWLLEQELDRLSRLEHEGKASELNEIRANSPNAIPDRRMRSLWRLFFADRIKTPWRDYDLDFYGWMGRLKHDGLTVSLRLELRELLAPRVSLRRPFRWGAEEDSTSSSDRMRQIVDFDVALTADGIRSGLHDIANERWKAHLPDLLDDFERLLQDALDLLSEMGEADDRSDRSHWDLPSISDHWQNRGFNEWTTLIELVRDSWLEIRASDPPRASRIARSWFDRRSASFKRLALFAASYDGCISADEWVSWLLSESSWWLWSVDTGRETYRLLVLQGKSLSAPTRARLESAILAGPPREMFRADIEQERWDELVSHSVWLHLAKLNAAGAPLGSEAQNRLSELSAANSDWKLATNERDEFSHWMSGTGDPDYEDQRVIDRAPRKRGELTQWLKQPATDRSFMYESTWRDTCRTRFFHSLLALCDISREGLWPVQHWREALQVWAEEKLQVRSWRYAAVLVQTLPDQLLPDIVHPLTWWLDTIANSVDTREDIFLGLCRRILSMEINAESGITKDGKPIEQPVTEAINHPVGHVTQALLTFWFKREPNDNDGLPIEIETFFTELSDTTVRRFVHGRVLLASRLIALYRVAPDWTRRRMLPLLNWNQSSSEAKASWEGFLWSPRLYKPLLLAIKAQFLQTAEHYRELGEHSRQFAAFLTYAALEQIEGYTAADFQAAFAALPQDGLNESARVLSQALESAGEQREEYWRNRVLPLWQHIWPKSRELTSTSIAESLARMSTASGSEFPSVVRAVIDWLHPVAHPNFVIHKLAESSLCSRFPEASLELLAHIIEDQQWPTQELVQCLEAIAKARPALVNDGRYTKLAEYARRRGA